MPATILCQLYFHELLGLGDVRIVYADGMAADLFGVAHPSDLVYRFLSDFQDAEWREYGRLRWALRKLGHPIPLDYCTMIRRPDGEMVGQGRELVGTGVGMGGDETYHMRIKPVREVDHLAHLDLATYGVSKPDVERFTGKYSVRELRTILDTNKKLLSFGERFTTIIERLEELRKRNVVNAPTALDAALLPHVGWSLSEKKPVAITLEKQCIRCGWKWKPEVAAPAQCPHCRLRQALTRAR